SHDGGNCCTISVFGLCLCVKFIEFRDDFFFCLFGLLGELVLKFTDASHYWLNPASTIGRRRLRRYGLQRNSDRLCGRRLNGRDQYAFYPRGQRRWRGRRLRIWGFGGRAWVVSDIPRVAFHSYSRLSERLCWPAMVTT